MVVKKLNDRFGHIIFEWLKQYATCKKTIN